MKRRESERLMDIGAIHELPVLKKYDDDADF
jgi:hypothetical protein